MTIKINLILLLALILTPLGASAVRFNLYYLSNQATYETSGTKANPSSIGGYGLSAEFGGLGPHTGFELGYQQTRREIKSSTNTHTLTYTEIPFLLKYHPTSFLDLGAGVYSGQAGSTVSSTDPNVTTLESIGITNPDFGSVFSVGLNFTVKKINLFFEGRYTTGLYNLSSNTAIVAKFDQMQMLLGVCFGSCEKSGGGSSGGGGVKK